MEISFLKMKRFPEHLDYWGKNSCFMFTCGKHFTIAVGTQIGQLVWFYQNVCHSTWPLLWFYHCLLGFSLFCIDPQLKWASMIGFYLYLLPNVEETRTRALKFLNKVLIKHFPLKIYLCYLEYLTNWFCQLAVSFRIMAWGVGGRSPLPYSSASTVNSLKLDDPTVFFTFMVIQRWHHSVETIL